MELQNWKRAKFFSSSPIFLPGWRVWRRRMCLQSSDRESWHHNRILRLTLYKLTWWIRMRGFQRIITQTKGTKNNGVEVVVDSKKTKLTNTFDDEGKPFWHQMQAVDCVDLPSWSWNGQASYNLKEKREGGVTYTHFFISLEYISSSKKNCCQIWQVFLCAAASLQILSQFLLSADHRSWSLFYEFPERQKGSKTRMKLWREERQWVRSLL